MIEPDFSSMMTQTLTVESFQGFSGGGSGTYGSGVSVNFYMVNEQKMVRDSQGQEVASDQKLILDKASGVALNDRITLPNGDQPPILRITQQFDELGPHHLEIDL